MVKAKMKNNDLIFGLSKENLVRLVDKKPIVFNLKEMGLEDRNIVIMYGDTETSIAEEITEVFGK